MTDGNLLMSTSPLHSAHEESGTRFTDFGGWTMPVQHDSVLDEHEAVRTDVGVFDVSHLGRFEVSDPRREVARIEGMLRRSMRGSP